MKKNYVQNIIIHDSEGIDSDTLTNKINKFHAEVIERRLSQSNLTVSDKIQVIDKILESLKSREQNGVIK